MLARPDRGRDLLSLVVERRRPDRIRDDGNGRGCPHPRQRHVPVSGGVVQLHERREPARAVQAHLAGSGCGVEHDTRLTTTIPVRHTGVGHLTSRHCTAEDRVG